MSRSSGYRRKQIRRARSGCYFAFTRIIQGSRSLAIEDLFNMTAPLEVRLTQSDKDCTVSGDSACNFGSALCWTGQCENIVSGTSRDVIVIVLGRS